MGRLSQMIQAFVSRFETPQAKSTDELMAAGAVLVDVRTAGEFSAGHIEGALWLPLDRIGQDIARVVPDTARPLVLYCRSGARSAQACAIVRQRGYGSAVNGGGFRALATALNRPIVAGQRRDA